MNRKPPSLLFSFTRPPLVKNSSPSGGQMTGNRNSGGFLIVQMTDRYIILIAGGLVFSHSIQTVHRFELRLDYAVDMLFVCKVRVYLLSDSVETGS